MKSKQKAGDGSTQIQANSVSIGVSVEDVQKIVRTEIELSLSNFRNEALEKYLARGDKMTRSLMELLLTNQNNLDAFKDPDFNFALKDAARAVASNEADHTEDLLVQILVNRAEHRNSNRTKIVTKKAIEAADKLSSEGLNALTTLWALFFLSPDLRVPAYTVARLQKMYDIMFGTLKPAEPKLWTDELELLGLISIPPNTAILPFDEFLSRKFATYLRPGISTEQWVKINNSLQKQGHDIRKYFIQHPLKEGFVLINSPTEEKFRESVGSLTGDEHVGTLIKKVISTNNFDAIDTAAKQKLLDILFKSPALTIAQEWWGKLPAINISPVGQAIGFLYAKRFLNFDGADTLDEYLNLQ